MPAPHVTTIRPGVTFTPDAAASFRRVERDLDRQVDVNSTYRDWDWQMSMYQAWQAWVNGIGPKPWHSRAVHPKYSKHCTGLALDSDDWRRPGFNEFMAEHGWIRVAANDPTEQHHFEYQWWRDTHRGRPAPAQKDITPVPVEEEDDMMKATVHARVDNKRETEWMLGHPEIGLDLKPGQSRLSDAKDVKTFRGYMVTVDPGIGAAWARIYAGGSGDLTSATGRAGYVAIQGELTRLSVELGQPST